MNAEQFIKLTSMTPEEQDTRRAREINALNDAGLATWDEIRELTKIRRRQVLRSLDKEQEHV